MIDLITLIVLIPAIILGSFGSIYLKKGAKDFTLNPKKWKNNAVAVFGLFLYGLSMILYLVALKRAELIIVYSLSSFVYVGVAFLSVKMLNEKMNNFKWIGIFLIIIGSFMVVL